MSAESRPTRRFQANALCLFPAVSGNRLAPLLHPSVFRNCTTIREEKKPVGTIVPTG
jgi:hypothetical protein